MPTRRELIALAMEAKLPIATLDPECKWVSSRDQAAIDAFTQLPVQDKEEGFAIYKNPEGQFCYSIPVPGKEKSFKFKTDQSGGLRFDGIGHTHPDSGHKEMGVSSDLFSPDDVKVAKALKRPSYIRTNRTGEVKRFEPGVSPVDRRNASPGDVISRREMLGATYDAAALAQVAASGAQGTK